MEKKIDIIPFLEGIVEKNTRSYQSDFSYDEKRLQAAMLEVRQEDRTFLWLSRPCGTNCVLEREAFLRETGAHSIWTHYEYDAEHIKAFRIIVAPGRIGSFVLGKVQPLDYWEQVQRIKQNAIHVQTMDVVFEDGASITMLYRDYSQHFRSLLSAHGKIERIRYQPENEAELACILQTERMISAAKKRPLHPQKPSPPRPR